MHRGAGCDSYKHIYIYICIYSWSVVCDLRLELTKGSQIPEPLLRFDSNCHLTVESRELAGMCTVLEGTKGVPRHGGRK